MLPARANNQQAPLAEFRILAGFTPGERDVLSEMLKQRTYKRGETIIHAGDPGR